MWIFFDPTHKSIFMLLGELFFFLQWTNKLHEPRSRSRAICLFCDTIHSPWTQKKDTHSLYLQCFQQRVFLKFCKKIKVIIQNYYSNGHLTSFDVLITAHVIRPNCRKFCWLCSSRSELKKISRVQLRKYDTIVKYNIMNKLIQQHSICYLSLFQELSTPFGLSSPAVTEQTVNTTTSVYDTWDVFIHPHWYQFPLVSDKWHYIIGIYITIVGITGILGNSLVIWVFSS